MLLNTPKDTLRPPSPAWTKVYRQANTQARLCISVYTRSPRGFTILTPVTFAITVSWELQTQPEIPQEAAEQSADEGAACVKRCSHFVICTRESTARGNIFGQMFQHVSLQNNQEQSICEKKLVNFASVHLQPAYCAWEDATTMLIIIIWKIIPFKFLQSGY